MNSDTLLLRDIIRFVLMFFQYDLDLNCLDIQTKKERVGGLAYCHWAGMLSFLEMAM